MCKNKGKHCTNVVDVITLVPLNPRTSDMTAADAMTPKKVLHQLVTLADAMTPMKVLHQLVTLTDAMSPVKVLYQLVTLAFISVFLNKM